MTNKTTRKRYTIAAQERYNQKIDITKVTANPTTEPDIYEWVTTRENKSGEIKALIKKEIAAQARKKKKDSVVVGGTPTKETPQGA